MSVSIWVPAGGGPIAFIGRLEMRDMHIPVTGKDEWGMDTLERSVRGPANLFEDYGKALRQGAEFKGYRLQSWRPIEDKLFPGFSLTYKGLQAGIPDALIANTRAELTSSISASDLHVTTSDGVIVSATKEVKYIAPQSSYKYIRSDEPNAPKYNKVRGVAKQDESALQILDSRITVTFEDGKTKVLTGNAPSGVVTALATTPTIFVIGPNATPVTKTPYWECEDQVQLKYPGS